MKKVFFAAFAVVMLCGTFTSCKKECMCTEESVTGLSKKVETSQEYPTCKDVETFLEGASLGLVDYTCK